MTSPARGPRAAVAAGLALGLLPWFLPAGMARAAVPEWGMALSLAGFIAAGLGAAKAGGPLRRWAGGVAPALIVVAPATLSLQAAPALTTWCPPLGGAYASWAPWAPLPAILLGSALGAVGRPGARPAWGRLGWFLLASSAFAFLQVLAGPRMSPYHPALGKAAFHFSTGGWDASGQAVRFALLVAVAAGLLVAHAAWPRLRAASLTLLAVLVVWWAALGDHWGGGVGAGFRRAFAPVASWPAEAPEVEVLATGRPDGAGRLAARAGALARDHRERLGLPYGGPLRIYLFASDEEEAFWTGVDRVDFVKPWQGTVHLSRPEPGTTHLSHELAHAVLAAVGPPPLRVPLSPVAVEGAAVAMSEFMDTEEGQWRHVAFADGAAEAPVEILGAAAFWAGNFRLSYQRSGGLLGWLLMTQGPGPFKEWYRTLDWEEAFGAGPEDLLPRWGAYLASLEVPDRARRESALLYAARPRYLDACVVPWPGHLAALSREDEGLVENLALIAAGSRTPGSRADSPGADDLRQALADRALRGQTGAPDLDTAIRWTREQDRWHAEWRAAGIAEEEGDLLQAAARGRRALAGAPTPEWRLVIGARLEAWDPLHSVAEAAEDLEASTPWRLMWEWRGEWGRRRGSVGWSRVAWVRPGSGCGELAPVASGSVSPSLRVWGALACGPPAATEETLTALAALDEPTRRWMLQRVVAFAQADLGPGGDPLSAMARADTVGRADATWGESPALGRIRLLAEALLPPT